MRFSMRAGWAALFFALAAGAATPARATPLLDVVFAMDSSGSMSLADWNMQEDFVESLITTALPRDLTRVGVVQFATGATPVIPLTLVTSTSASMLADDVEGLSYLKGSTYTKDAVQDAITMFNQQSVDENLKLLVLITDGIPNPPSSQSPCSLKTTLDSKGIKTVILGIGSGFSSTPVKCLVNDTATDIVLVNNFTPESFDAVFPDIAALIEDTTPVPAPAGWSMLALGAWFAARRRARVRKQGAPR